MSIPSTASIAGQELLVHGQQYTVVSLRPIWAWAIIFAGKDVENRTLLTDQRGRVLIHASTERTSLREDHNLRAEVSFLSGIGLAELPVVFPRGAILGSVEIVDCNKEARSKWAVPGQHHWLLREPRKLPSPLLNVEGTGSFWSFTFEAKGRRIRSSGVYLASHAGGDAHSSEDDESHKRAGRLSRGQRDK